MPGDTGGERRRIRLTSWSTRVAIATAVAGVAAAAVTLSLYRPGLPDGLIQANGRIEGDRITVASKLAGRVRELRVTEGDTVTAGQVLVVLDDTQADARVAQARAAVDQAEQRVRHAEAALSESDAAVARSVAALTQAQARHEQTRHALATVDARLAAARTALGVLREESLLGIETAEAALDSTRADLARALAAEEQTGRDAERARRLVEQELVDRQRAEQAQLAWTAARSQLEMARTAVRRDEQRLADARLGPRRVQARAEEVRALEAERAHAVASVAEAAAAVEQARLAISQARAVLGQARAAAHEAAGARDQAQAALVEAESVLGDLTLAAPAAGVVTTRVADLGEVVGAGAPLLDIVDLDRLYLKVFVPETDIGRLRLDLPAQVYIDALPGQPFPARVRFIASRAEFTPKEIQTTEERVKLVYAVKLYFDANPGHRLTPGLPADAVIRWDERVPWRPPRW